MLSDTLCLQLQNEYPEQWPSFWKDLLGMLPEGPGVVDMFCRILVAIDDDVISLDISRQACTSAHDGDEDGAGVPTFVHMPSQ